MRVLLAQPPLQPGREVTPPLGLCTLASWLRSSGYDVRILDLDLEGKSASEFSESFSHRLFAKYIADFEPDVVGVTSMYNNSLQAQRLLQLAKQMNSMIVTVSGGSHFGALGIQSLRWIPELDYVIEGEAELAFGSLLKALDHKEEASQIPRLCYRHAGECKRNPPGPLLNLSDAPPMWTTLQGCIGLDRYAETVSRQATRRLIYIEAGRGCPFACTFCATSPYWQRSFRVKPVQKILDEIRFLHQEFGYDSFILVHDLLTVDQRFVSKFCDKMLEAQLPVEWMANSRTDIQLRGLLPKLKASGCWKLFFGVESASPRIQASIDKHLSPNGALAHIRELLDNGISATCSFVIGFPEESASELSSTIELATRLKLWGVETVQFHRLRLWPPAPLSLIGLRGEFDEDALRIEYPFIEVPPEDITAIRAAPEFFEGYFAPPSSAGSAAELTQVEMFFHHAVALAPLTVSVLSGFVRQNLVPSFYAALSEFGGIARQTLDWESGNLYGNWIAIAPLLERWVQEHAKLHDWQCKIVHGLMEYEAHRLHFVSGSDQPINGILCFGKNWVAFPVVLDLNQTLETIRAGSDLSAKVLRESLVVLVREGARKFVVYTLDYCLLPGLTEQRPELFSALGLDA